MYINFWYPICTSEELDADKPQQTQVLGLRFVAFRDAEGKPHVLSDTCVHRGGSLSKGKVVDGCVVCPYHGWRFAGDGKCQLVPSVEAGAKLPARAKVDSYPVQEKYGIVFAFLGDLPDRFGDSGGKTPLVARPNRNVPQRSPRPMDRCSTWNPRENAPGCSTWNNPWNPRSAPNNVLY